MVPTLEQSQGAIRMEEPLDLDELATALSDAGRPWEQDLTPMTLMTEAERSIRLGFHPPPGEQSLDEAAADFEASPANDPVQELELLAPAESFGAPASYDLRNVGGVNYTTEVRDQGACGSCVAFGSAAVLETTYRRQHGAVPVNLSEAHLFYCHAKEEGRTCANGWWPENALKKARDKGVTADEYFPYTAGDQSCSLKSGWQSNLANAVGLNKMDSVAEMKTWISTKGSITGCFVVYQDFYSYRSGVYRHVTGNSVGGHCVEIVGYDDSQKCWICKNSWGKGWGEGGFFRIGYGQCGIETYSGPWGVADVKLSVWRHNLGVRGLWANSAADNAWVHLDTVGWRRLAHASTVQTLSMLSQAAAAKGAGRKVSVHDDNGTIQTIYA